MVASAVDYFIVYPFVHTYGGIDTTSTFLLAVQSEVSGKEVVTSLCVNLDIFIINKHKTYKQTKNKHKNKHKNTHTNKHTTHTNQNLQMQFSF